MSSMRFYSRCFLIFLLSSVIFCAHSAVVIKGNDGASKTFTFSVGPVITNYTETFGVFKPLVSADQAIAGNIYSLAQYEPAAGQFVPVGVSKITFNNTKDAANPLQGQRIKYLNALRDFELGYVPVVVTDSPDQHGQFYAVPKIELLDKNKPTNVAVNVASSAIVADAAGAAAGTICALTAAAVGDEGNQPTIFGAVTESGQTFGAGNSGICMARFERSPIKDSDPAAFNYFVRMLDCVSGVYGNRAALLNGTNAAVKVGAAATFAPASLIDLWWDARLQRLYIVGQVTAAGGPANGARSIIVCRVNKGILYFEKFVPDNVVLESTNTQLVCANNGASVSAYKVRTMHTSTGLAYLIVNGGNGALGDVANRVYAVPLVNKMGLDSGRLTDPEQGTAANVTVAPQTMYMSGDGRYLYRTFNKPATRVEQLFSGADVATQVGAGALPLISSAGDQHLLGELMVAGDAVYACVPYDYANVGGQAQQPGVYQSRAIFGSYGSIISWTPWTRVNGSAELIDNVLLDYSNGGFWFVSKTTPGGSFDMVKKTVWGQDDKDGLFGGTSSDATIGLINVFNTFFSASPGSIQALGVFDQNLNTVGIPLSGLAATTVIMAAGKDSFAFAKTGDSNGVPNTIKPYTGDFRTGLAQGTEGVFPAGAGRVFTVTGGALSLVGPPTALTIFSDSTHSWIAVGGVNGVVVLSDAQGQGFDPVHMPTGFSFKKIGDYRFVQKLVGDGHYLYILTMNSLERVVIDPAAFVTGNIQRMVIARPQDLGLGVYGSFSDLLVGNNVALLATNRGLYRIANGQSIKNGKPAWVPFNLNESPGAIISLSSASARTTQSFEDGAQVFALAAYEGYEQACLYRLCIREGRAVTDETVTTIGDCYVKNLPSYFVSFGQFRNTYTDDGATRFTGRPLNIPRAQALFALPPLQVAAPLFPANRSVPIGADVPLDAVMAAPVRSSASGAWVLYGNFGLRVNE